MATVTDALNEAPPNALPLRAADGSIRDWVLVDPEDFEIQSEFCWYIESRTGYVRRKIVVNRRETVLRLAREVMGIGPRGDELVDVDHINGNRLDNRKSNLRIVTHGQNQQNRQAGYGASRFRGVTRNKTGDKWCAYVHMGGRRHHLGTFIEEEEAASAASSFRREHMPFSMADQA